MKLRIKKNDRNALTFSTAIIKCPVREMLLKVYDVWVSDVTNFETSPTDIMARIVFF